MEIRPLALPEVLLITPIKHGDDRGFFSETFSRKRLAEAGFEKAFVQDNHSLSGKRGILRGLHFQRAPHAQDKLVRVTRGAVFDVAVDVHIGRLRKALNDGFEDDPIRTVRSAGYSLETEAA